MRSLEHDDSPKEGELPGILDMVDEGGLYIVGWRDQPVEGGEVGRVIMGGDRRRGIGGDDSHCFLLFATRSLLSRKWNGPAASPAKDGFQAGLKS